MKTFSKQKACADEERDTHELFVRLLLLQVQASVNGEVRAAIFCRRTFPTSGNRVFGWVWMPWELHALPFSSHVTLFSRTYFIYRESRRTP